MVANSSSQVMKADQEFLKTQIAELQTSTSALTAELTEMRNYISQQGRKLASTEQLNCDLRTKIKTLQQTAFAAEAALATKNESLRRMEDQMMVARDEFESLRAHINEQEDKLGSVEELLSRKHEALTLMVATADHASQEWMLYWEGYVDKKTRWTHVEYTQSDRFHNMHRTHDVAEHSIFQKH